MDQRILGADEAELRAERTSVKWMAFPPDVLPLWVAEMDAAPCPSVVDAVKRGRAAGRHRLRLGAALRRRGRAVGAVGLGLGDRPRRDDPVVTDVMIGAT